jgi:hypothetical protein
LHSNKIRKEGLEFIIDGLKNNSTLKFINLSGNSLGKDGGKMISDTMEHFRLNEIKLVSNSLTADNIYQILSVLDIKDSSIKSISLEFNRKDEKVQSLASKLNTNKLIHIDFLLNPNRIINNNQY